MAIAEGPSAGPLTATGTDPRNVDGQAICITVFSTVKWWGRVWLPLVFLYARLVPSAHGTLARLSFIHFARWTLVKRLPEQRLRRPHLFFESNFNGGWEEYIDAFSHILTRGMTLFSGARTASRRRCPPAASRPTSSATRSWPATSTAPIPTRPRPSCWRRSSSTRSCATSGAHARHGARGLRARLARVLHRRAGVPVNTDPDRSGQAGALTVLTPITQGAQDDLRDYLEGLRRRASPLARLPRTHFGRWVIVADFVSDGERGPDHLASPHLLFTPASTGPGQLPRRAVQRARPRGTRDLGPLRRRAAAARRRRAEGLPARPPGHDGVLRRGLPAGHGRPGARRAGRSART